MRPPVIALRGITRTYQMGEVTVSALRGIDLQVEHGEFVAIMGPSGSGKSTMMNILGCLDRPSSGTYLLDEVDVTNMTKAELAEVRNRKIGFVFQGFNLLSKMTAVANVALPTLYAGISPEEGMQRAETALTAVGLATRAHHRPNQLSGGQQQRVAIARALVNRPPMILADEPTGNLDTRTSLEVMAILQRLHREQGITIVLVTHEPEIAAFAGRVVRFRDGLIVSDERVAEPLLAEAELARLGSAPEGSVSA